MAKSNLMVSPLAGCRPGCGRWRSSPGDHGLEDEAGGGGGRRALIAFEHVLAAVHALGGEALQVILSIMLRSKAVSQ